MPHKAGSRSETKKLVSKRLRKPLGWRAHDSTASNAHAVLPAMAHAYFASGRRVAEGKPKPADFHPFRLATKRFRYTLELFREFYGPTLEAKLDLLKPVQDALGDLNDAVATREQFPQDGDFAAYLERRAERKARAFRHLWKTRFDASGEEEAWRLYLAGSGEVEAAVHG